MISKYYQRELERLRELGAEFSRAHPAIAPMIAAEGSDPDVERILEGTAFLSGLIYEKLDDELPEVIHPLLQTLAPHYLRPIPACTLIRFRPRPALRESLVVPRGTAINSTPVNGTECTFTTCRDVRILPLRIAACAVTPHGRGEASVRLDFALNDMPVEALPPDCLNFFLAGSYAEASLRFLTLRHYLAGMSLIPGEGGSRLRLGKAAFVPGGFDEAESLLPYPSRSFSGYRHVQEYFTLPERFCSFSISGLERWTDRGTGPRFSLELHLSGLPDARPEFSAEHFLLFVSPAVNIFPMASEPIFLDHKSPSYLVRPSARNRASYQVYSVDAVRGVMQGATAAREYENFLLSNPVDSDTPLFSLSTNVSPLSDDVELWISVAYAPDQELAYEVLSLDLHCTNGNLPEKLHSPDIRVPTSTSPELADFEALRQPTAPVLPPLGTGTLWRLLSHLYLNLLSIADADRVRSILNLYIFSKTKDRAGLLANRKRVQSIEHMQVKSAERFVRDALMRGSHISLVLQAEGFAGPGDMYLFGSVLDTFFSAYSAVNAYTQLTITDATRKDEFAWPARLGFRTLL